MAQLKNTSKIFDLDHGQAITVGNNRTITRVRYGSDGYGFRCRLHCHGIALIGIEGASGIAHVTLNACGYPTRTTAAAMSDFARAFGCTLSVSFAKGDMSIRFKDAAGTWKDRDLDRDTVNGPFAMGRDV